MPPDALSAIQKLDNLSLSAMRAQTGIQPKASKLPPLIPVYSCKVALTGFQDDLPSFSIQQKLTSPINVGAQNAPTMLPKGAKLLQLSPPLLPSSCVQGGVVVSEQQITEDDVNRFVALCNNVSKPKTGVCETQIWGIPWKEDDFIRQMVKFGHPAVLTAGLPDVLQDTTEFYKSMEVHDIVQYKAKRLGYWLRRLVDLKADEERLKESMDAEVVMVVRQKNLLLWEEMLRAVDYPDMGVVDEMKNGTELVGCIAKTGIWPTKFQPASVSLDELRDIACRERDGPGAQFAGLCDGDIGDQVWKKTFEEVETGALVGPIPLDQVPPDYPLSRRFGIRQGAKVRCIDDFSRSSVNSSVQSCESPKPHTLDVFAAMCVRLMSELEGGEQWYGRRAYRQCAVKPSSAAFSYIMVQHPQSHELAAFRMRALPFGSICSVHSFLRISHSLWYVLVKEFKLLMTNYFDDFVSLSMESERTAVTSCVHMYFKLLGWVFAETGEKAPEFNQLFQALGVNICVQSLHVGLVTVGNIESRRRELIEFISKVIESRQLAKHDALRLRGRLQFAAGQVFGRIAKWALAAVSFHAYNSSSSSLSDETLFSLQLHKRFLELGRPRELKMAAEKPWFIQTDACYDSFEDGIMAGIGAVLFNPAGEPVKFFSHRLSPTVVKKLNPCSKKTAIYECEFFSLFCSFFLWGDVANDAVVIYTDNNGVRIPV